MIVKILITLLLGFLEADDARSNFFLFYFLGSFHCRLRFLNRFFVYFLRFIHQMVRQNCISHRNVDIKALFARKNRTFLLWIILPILYMSGVDLFDLLHWLFRIAVQIVEGGTGNDHREHKNQKKNSDHSAYVTKQAKQWHTGNDRNHTTTIELDTFGKEIANFTEYTIYWWDSFTENLCGTTDEANQHQTLPHFMFHNIKRTILRCHNCYVHEQWGNQISAPSEEAQEQIMEPLPYILPTDQSHKEEQNAQRKHDDCQQFSASLLLQLQLLCCRFFHCCFRCFFRSFGRCHISSPFSTKSSFFIPAAYAGSYVLCSTR